MNTRICQELDRLPAHLKDRYRRLALVSLDRHAEQVAGDDDTLLVTCNWLQWQLAVADGRHCLHFEALYDGADPENMADNHYFRACDWAYEDGRDITLFRGVSLGRKLAVDVARAMLEWDRLTRTLERLIERYRPEEIVYFDYRAEITGLGPDQRRAAVAEIAGRHDVRVIDRRDPPAADDLELPDKSHLLSAPAPRRTRLLGLFETAADWASRARRMFDPARPAILILATHRTSVPLLEKFSGQDVFPMLPARQFPNKKKASFLSRSWARGVLLVSAPDATLDAAGRAEVDAIVGRTQRRRRDNPGTGREAAIRTLIHDRFLGRGRIHQLAAQVIRAERMLDRHAPAAIFADGMLNTDINIFMELARPRRIPVATTWHSPIVQKSKIPIFGNDPRIGLLSNAVFTWGRLHEDWLADTGATSVRIRTGNPLEVREAAPARGRMRRALVLQLAAPGGDVGARATDEYDYFVRVVRLLQDLGHDEIRFKPHPSCAVAPYYQRIAAFFDLPCDIVQDGSFEEHLAWSDFVIGPIYTGALSETLCGGKPYFPIHLPGSSLDPAYLKGMEVFRDMASLARALDNENRPEQRETLYHLTGRDECPDPVAAIWTALRDMAARPTPATGVATVSATPE